MPDQKPHIPRKGAADEGARRATQADAIRRAAGRVAAGDERAFEAIHERFDAGLRRFFLTRGGGRVEQAEELAQRTWVQVWRSMSDGKYDPRRAAPSTFIYAVASKMWLRHCRTLTRPASTEADGLLARLLEGGDPADLLHAAELLEGMRHCLRCEGCLSEEERAIVLAAAHGETERALGRRFGLAASSINARKQAAYAKLRRCMAERGLFSDEAPPPSADPAEANKRM
jgi:RNA polymerase sigma factor (sigma-70 family)